MNLKIKLQVTEEDIRINGHRRDYCPVNRALKRTLPKGAIEVSVDTDRCRFRLGGYPYYIDDNRVRRWVQTYDNRKEVRPFTREVVAVAAS